MSIAAALLKCDFAELQQWSVWPWPKSLAFKIYPQITTAGRTWSLPSEALQTQIELPFQGDVQSSLFLLRINVSAKEFSS